MAWYPDDRSDDGKMSEYNSAALKMRRLDELLSILNSININLLAFNDEVKCYNYQYKFNLCDGLFQEVESKLNKEERSDAERLRSAIQIFMDCNPVVIKKRVSLNPPRTIKIPDERVWKILKEWLFKYETLVRKLMDAHGMDTAYDDDSALF